MRHDGGAAIDLGIDYLKTFGENDEGEWANRCSIALGAYDYLTETIGLDIGEVFGKWNKIPVVFMPAHVSNHYGRSDKGSLIRLLNDAVRAYVFGAPAAAIAMCLAALEIILKKHYGDGDWADPKEKLAKVIALADERYERINKNHLDILKNRADEILHRFTESPALTDEDDRTILMFLGTLKSYIETAPKP